MISNEGRVVLVTGGAGGVGRATTELLLEQGARVGVIDSNSGLLEKTVAELGRHQPRLLALTGDICDEGTLRRFVESTLGKFDRIDSVCNVAGVSGPGTLEHHLPRERRSLLHDGGRVAG